MRLPQHLHEAKRLHGIGMHLCLLKPHLKEPFGDDWNRHPVASIVPDATGYGVILAANSLASVDFDHELSAQALEAVTGLSLEETGPGGTRIIDVLVESVERTIAGNVASGRGALVGALQSSYGLNRAAGAY